MNLVYHSTRNGEETATASEAILKGLTSDGGLFVPNEIPKLQVTLEELTKMSYQEIAYAVMKEFLTDFTEEELKACIQNAYDSKFDTSEIAPMKKIGNVYYLELFHGATIAFKDMALSILPHLLVTSARKNQVKNEIVILTATSGDTGKAALAGFADVPGTKIIVFYPKSGVSPIQEKQMVTQKGQNTYVIGIHGNFDDAQTGVKKMFSNKELAKVMNQSGYQFSSANSINIGRLVPQVVYYVTTSPSMDILISSNLERLIYRIAGNDPKQCAEFMTALTAEGVYTITEAMKDELSEFYGAYGDEQETAEKIQEVYQSEGYVMDTHTAVAAVAYDKYVKETKDETPTVIASTASPYKFTRSVMNAIDPKYDEKTDFQLVDELQVISKTEIPKAIEEIRTAPVIHQTVCETAAMEDEVKKILNI